MSGFIEFHHSQLEQSLARRFEQQVERYPDHVAVSDHGEQVTYRALNQAANAVARAVLRQRSEAPEPVALLLGQGLGAVVSLLGVLKTGKFYVPLDPSHPDRRLATVVALTQPGLLLTDGPHLARARQLAGTTTGVLNVAEIEPDHEELGVGIPVAADGLAYVLFTSGSTGQPKGVMQTQRNVMHFTMVSTNQLLLRASDRLSLLNHHSTAAAASHMFGALLNGAALCPRDLRQHELADLADWLVRERITGLHCVPTVFRRFMRGLPRDRRLPDLRFVRLGGEPVHHTDIELAGRHVTANCLLGVSYGSTERNFMRWYPVNAAPDPAGQVMPVGYAVPDTEVLILDDRRREVTTGEVGQIAVRSEYLSPGYWRNPELTAEVFLADPAGGAKRTYLTGDLGRLRPDGCLLHLGRADAQVKIRGNRVETAEVEAALMGLASVTEAAVVARVDESGEARLVAYLALAGPAAPSARELRTALAGQLPLYMIPTAFIRMDALPLLPGGKVDRQALPEPEWAQMASAAADPEPHNADEMQLLRIWQEVLDNRHLGVADDFFEAGGDSLQAVAILAGIEQHFGQNLSVLSLLQNPTVAQLAQELRRSGQSAPLSDRPVAEGQAMDGIWAFQEHGPRPASFWLPGGVAEEAVLLRYVSLGRSLGPEWPFYVLDLSPDREAGRCFTRVEDLAADCLRRVRRVQPRGPYLLGGLCVGGLVAFEMASQLLAAGEEVGALILRDTVCPGSRAQERLARARITPRRIAAVLMDLPRVTPGRRLFYLLQKATTAVRVATTAVRVAAQRCTAVGRARHDYRQMLARYRPRHYPGHLVLLVTDRWREQDPTLGWRDLALGGLETLPIPGDHLSWDATQIQVAAAHVRSCFERVALSGTS